MNNKYYLTLAVILSLLITPTLVSASFLSDIGNGLSNTISNIGKAVANVVTNVVKTVSNVVNKVVSVFTGTPANTNTNSNTGTSNTGSNTPNVDPSKIVGNGGSTTGTTTSITTSGGKTIKATVVSSGSVSTEISQYATWYDLNIKYSRIECLGCIEGNLVAGHTYNFYYSIKNYGNTINTKPFRLKGKITTPNKVIPIDYEINYYIAGGAEVLLYEPISNFGIKADGNLEDWSKGTDNISIQVSLEITDDNGLVSPMIQKISTPVTITSFNQKTYDDCVASIKVSSSLDATTRSKVISSLKKSCNTQAQDVTSYADVSFQYSCPEGSSTDSTGSNCKTESVGNLDTTMSDKFSTSIQIKQLSPLLLAKSGFII